MQLFIVYMPGLQLMKNIFEFNAIGTDILNRRCAHATRDQRHIFHTGIALPDAMQYQLMPHFSTAGTHIKEFIILAQEFYTLNTIVQYHAIYIAGEQNIASPAQYKRWACCGQRSSLLQCLL